MGERSYCFKVDGDTKWLTIPEAILLQSPEVNARINQIIQNSKTVRMKKDGFEPGYQQNIEEYVTCYKDYQGRLKEKGLVEVGYDINFREHEVAPTGLANSALLPAIKELGIELSDNEMDGLASGELLKDIKLND